MIRICNFINLLSAQIKFDHVLLAFGPHLHYRLVLDVVDTLEQRVLLEITLLRRDALSSASLYLPEAIVYDIYIGCAHVDCFGVVPYRGLLPLTEH